MTCGSTPSHGHAIGARGRSPSVLHRGHRSTDSRRPVACHPDRDWRSIGGSSSAASAARAPRIGVGSSAGNEVSTRRDDASVEVGTQRGCGGDRRRRSRRGPGRQWRSTKSVERSPARKAGSAINQRSEGQASSGCPRPPARRQRVRHPLDGQRRGRPATDQELAEQRVVVAARSLVPSSTQSSMRMPRPVRRAASARCDLGSGRSRPTRVLGGQPNFDRVLCGICGLRRGVQHGPAEGRAGRDPELLLHEVEAGHELGHPMLDLQSRVDLQEPRLALGADEELGRGGIAQPDRRRATSIAICVQPTAESEVETRRGASSTSFWWRRWTEQSRSPRATTRAPRVAQQLDLHVAGAHRSPLEVDAAVAERGHRLMRGGQRAAPAAPSIGRPLACRVPSPAAALTSSGKPTVSASAMSASSCIRACRRLQARASRATTGTPTRVAARRAWSLSPRPMQRRWLGPTKTMPGSLDSASASASRSDRNP